MIYNLFTYFAQAYGEGAYSTDVYQSTATSSEGQTVEDVTTAPSTGFINSSPEVLVPMVLGASIVVAVVVTVLKKQIRKSRRQ